jgi:hypothetical protein
MTDSVTHSHPPQVKTETRDQPTPRHGPRPNAAPTTT